MSPAKKKNTSQNPEEVQATGKIDMMKQMEVVQWLKKRCQKTAKTSSLLSANEIERNRDIMQIF